MRFLITGLARSRTSWWAVVTGAAHEPVPFPDPWEGGISDGRAAPELGRILKEYAPRTLIVMRPPTDVFESALHYFGDDQRIDWPAVGEVISRSIDGLNDCLAHPLVKVITFDECNDEAEVRDALDWLGVSAPANLSDLMGMRIDTVRSHVFAKVARLMKEAA